MIYFSWILALVLLVPGCIRHKKEVVQIKTIRTVHEPSDLPMEYHVLDENSKVERKHGLLVIWYASGKKYVEQNYSKGKMEGICRIYREDGKLMIEGIYRRDKPWNGLFQVGHRIERYHNGRFVEVVQFP